MSKQGEARCPLCSGLVMAEYSEADGSVIEADCPTCGDVADELNKEWEESNE